MWIEGWSVGKHADRSLWKSSDCFDFLSDRIVQAGGSLEYLYE